MTISKFNDPHHTILASLGAWERSTERDMRKALKAHMTRPCSESIHQTMFSIRSGPDVLLLTTWKDAGITHIRLCWEDDFDLTPFDARDAA